MKRIKNDELKELIKVITDREIREFKVSLDEIPMGEIEESVSYRIEHVGTLILYSLCPNLFKRKKGSYYPFDMPSTKAILDECSTGIVKAIMSPSPFAKVIGCTILDKVRKEKK